MIQPTSKRRITRLVAAASVAAIGFGVLPISPASAAIADICPGPGQRDAFTDDNGNIHEPNINCAEAYGIVNGKTATTYDPNGNLTRGQAASILVQFAEVSRGTALPAGTNRFQDDNGSVHEANINKAAAAGFLEGFNDGTFRPTTLITRAQFASITVRTVQFLTGTTLTNNGVNDFDDDNGNVHESNIEKAVDNGILVGTGPRTFSPNANITRGQTASIIVGAAGNVLFPAGRFAPRTADARAVLAVTPTTPATTVTLNDTGANVAGDDRVFTVTGLNPATTFRITLVDCASIQTAANGISTFLSSADPASSTGFSVDIGPDNADIVSINGAAPVFAAPVAPATQTSRTATAMANSAGVLTFTVDATGAGCTIPVVYVNGGPGGTATTGGTSIRLETAATAAGQFARLIENFGLGGSFTATAAGTGVAAGASVTSRPELVSATIFQTNPSGPNSGTIIRYVFDENITGRLPNPALFFAYSFDGTRFQGDEATIDTTDSRAVFVRFFEGMGIGEAAGENNDLSLFNGLGASALRVATVEFGAVADDTFQTRGDQSFNPIGDATLNPGTTTGGQTRTFQAGNTDGPDLLAVGPFRVDPLNQTQSLVDFTFDEAATVTNLGGFHLVLQNGVTDIVCTVQSGSGTTTVTVVCPEGATGDLSTLNVARGYVDVGTVSDDVDDITINPAAITPDPAQGNLSPLQAADAGNTGNSETPDLVSATFAESAGTGNDVVLFSFDEPVVLPAGSTGGLFFVYDADGNTTAGTAGTALRSTANNFQVRVEFPDGTLFDAVGASVEEGAVQEDALPSITRPNQEDEVGVANSNTDTGGTTSTERTAGPDLTGVAVNALRDVFGIVTGFNATYTFDERLQAVLDPTGFFLVLGDGTQIQSTACAVGQVPSATPGVTQTSNTVTCSFGNSTGTTLNQPNQAVLGTVEFNAVDAFDAGPNNPEGAERATGATAALPQQ